MCTPSVGPTPKYAFFIYYQDETDGYAVHWRGHEWGNDHHADMRFWYHAPLNTTGYMFLLNHYGLPTENPDFSFEAVKKMSPEKLFAYRRKLEMELGLESKAFIEGIDY
jgi:hypothetical protein